MNGCFRGKCLRVGARFVARRRVLSERAVSLGVAMRRLPLAWSMLLLLCRVRSPVILLVPRCSLSPVTLTFFPVSASAPPKVLPIDSRLALPLPAGRALTVRRLYPEINRSLMLIKRKNRSLTPAAEAIWQEVRQQATLLAQQRAVRPAF